jgi:putative flavoprotein involved in K+ transport
MPDNRGMKLDCAVIGAGHVGLATSWHLARLGVQHVVFEGGRVGETWRTRRWDSFALNTPSWANVLPGQTEPAEPRDGFQTRDAWVRRLEDYATTQGLPVREATQITALEHAPGGGGFRLTTGGGDEIEARSVVVAAGFQRIPKLPTLATALPPSVKSLHTAHYRSPDQLPRGAVLVVGTAQSGGQIAEDLLDAGRRVFLAASTVGRIPRRYRGRDILEWLFPLGYFDQPVELADAAIRLAPPPMISGVGRYGHTLSLQLLAARGAVLLGRLRAIDDDCLHFENDLAASFAHADRISAQARQLIDQAIEEQGLHVSPAEQDAADEPFPDAEALTPPGELDLEAEGIASVIWATGFRFDLSWIGFPVVDGTGTLLHQGGRSPVPGLWFLGMPWLRSRKSAIIFGSTGDVAAIADEVPAFLAERA